VVLVIGSIEVLSVPASWVENIRSNTTRAGLGRESLKIAFGVTARSHIVATKIRAGVATEAALCFVFALSVHRVADKHTEARLESSDLTLSGRDVVDCNTTRGLCSEPVVEEKSVWNLRNTLITPITGLEKQVGGPVVREIISGPAGSAARNLGYIRSGHRGIKSISAYDLMRMRRWSHSRIDERIKTLDCDLRASESEMIQAAGKSLGLSDRRENKCGPKHSGREQLAEDTSR
jgi:hypothetical protein